MRILFADAIDPTTLERLEGLGHACELDPSLDAAGLPSRIADVDVLVVRSTRVTAEAIAAGRALQLIVRAGAGTDTIDTQAAADVGIYVANVPGRNAIAVAELTMGLLLAIDRRIPDAVADLRAGRWDKAGYGRADGLYGKTMGIVGLGQIGLAVAERAAAFGLRLLGLRRPERDGGVRDRIAALGVDLVDGLEELVGRADVVSLHVPSTPQTRRLVDARFCGWIREGAILLNTARGDLIDPDALLEAIEAKGIRVGLDVYPDEPASGRAAWRSALAAHPNVVGTHHVGASTAQAQRAIADGVVEIIDAFTRGEVRDCVNLAKTRLGVCTLHVRHYDRVGVLAQVLDLLRRGGLNVEQMENRIFEGGRAAVATIDVADEVPRELVASIETIPDVLHVAVVPAPGRGNDG
jgi:D-3-phosphoglycerate dehydrogenase